MIENKKYKQRWVPGAIVQIDLGDKSYGYAQVLEPPLVAFYDYKSEGDVLPTIQDITKSSVAFKISIMKQCITQDWKIIGKVEIDRNLNQWPDRFRYENLSKRLFIERQHMSPLPATWDECQHLECAAVWESHSIEQRLRDHFADRPSFFVESKKPGWVFMSIKEFYKQYGYDYVGEEEKQI